MIVIMLDSYFLSSFHLCCFSYSHTFVCRPLRQEDKRPLPPAPSRLAAPCKSTDTFWFKDFFITANHTRETAYEWQNYKLGEVRKANGRNSLLAIGGNRRFWKLFAESLSHGSMDFPTIGFIPASGPLSSSASWPFCPHVAQSREAPLYNVGLESESCRKKSCSWACYGRASRFVLFLIWPLQVHISSFSARSTSQAFAEDAGSEAAPPKRGNPHVHAKAA